MTEDEQKLKKVLAGTNLAWRLESGSQVIYFVDQWGREASITIDLLRKAEENKLRAVLMIFAVGAKEIIWQDGEKTIIPQGIILPSPEEKPECRE